MSYYREQLEDWLKKIEIKADCVMDVGGAANPVKNRVRSFDVKDYIILDNGAEETSENYKELDLNVEPLEIEELEGRADVLFCLEVLEYIWNPYRAFKTLYRLLKRKGVLYVSFPTIYPLHNPKNIDHMRYMVNGVAKLLDETGFVNYDIEPREATKGQQALAEFYSKEGMHPIKNDPAIFDIGYLVRAEKRPT